MKQRTHKLLALVLVVVMALSAVVPAFALDPFAYEGDEVTFINADGGAFGMFAPQEGTTCVINGDDVVIHYVPKNTTVYGWLHWGAIDDEELTRDITFNEDGTFDITLSKDNCGSALPVAPVKVKDGGTTSTQYYLAIPAEDKLEDVTPPVGPFPYGGETVTFINVDGGAFGMFAPQEGTTCVINGDDVVIHYVPKNTTVYGWLHWGAIDDEELTRDITFNEDGTFDITLSKDNCGSALPVAPVKVKDGGTTSTQYYLAIPAEDKLEDVTPEPEPQPEPEPEPAAEPFPYDGEAVTFINVDGGAFGMFAPQEGTTCAIDGDNVVIHYVPKNTTVYGWLHWGAIGDEELTRDITFNEDGTFDITLSKDNCGWALPVAPVKVKDGGTTSAQYYLAIPAEDKLDTVTPDPEPEPDPDPTPQPEPEPQPEDERIDLEIVNTTGMFKALYAYVINGESQSTLVVALTGNTYHYLYKGNYAQAVDNGDDRDQWIAGAQDADGKWTFTFPLAEGETYLPVVSISETYLAAYERGENDLERSFYPRQFVLDLTAKTLTVGDYDETVTVTVVNNAQGVSVADTAEMRVVGGPNSNNFRVAPVLQMLDDTYDQVTFPTVEGRKLTTATADLGADKTFAIDMLNAPTVFAFRDKEPVELQLRVKATGETVTVTMTVDLLAGTITIDGGEAAAYEFTAGADSTWTRGGGDLLLTVKRTADDETTFSRFTGVTVDGKALAESDYTAAAGSVNVTLKSAWLETLAAGSHEITVTFSDGSVTTTLTVREAGPTAPDTGDRTGALVALAGAFLLAAAALVILPARRKEA